MQQELHSLQKSTKQRGLSTNSSWYTFHQIPHLIHTHFPLSKTSKNLLAHTFDILRFHTQYKCCWQWKMIFCKHTLNWQVFLCTLCTSRIEYIKFTICMSCRHLMSHMACIVLKRGSKSLDINKIHCQVRGPSCFHDCTQDKFDC